MSVLKNLLNGNSSKFLIAVLAAVGESFQTGHFDTKSLVTGLIAAAAVYLIPNSSSAPPSSAPPASPAA